MDNRDIQILKKIISYCQRIEDNLSQFNNSREAFLSNTMLQDACCMCIVQIGELAGILTDETKALNKAIPWRAVKDTRNLYVHAYGSVNLILVWNTIQLDIPTLKTACKELLDLKTK